MPYVNDLNSKQAGWKRFEYLQVTSLSISITFDYDNLEGSSVRTTHVDGGLHTFKVDYEEMKWIDNQIDAALEMKARTIRLSLNAFDDRVEKSCKIRN